MQVLERGLVPDSLLRFGIRRICQRRLREQRNAGRDAIRLAARGAKRGTA
jgi:hypothetical protein